MNASFRTVKADKAKLVGLAGSTRVPFRVTRALLLGRVKKGESRRGSSSRGAGRARLTAPRVYLDTAILVKPLVHEPDSDFYARLVGGQSGGSFQLVLVECLSAPLRKERERAIDRSQRRRARRQAVADVGAS